MKFIFAIVISYLIGSIPTAYLFGKFTKGIDIREHGSGNIGATNVFRVLGKGPGIIVLVLDIIKGIIPVALVASIFGITGTWPLLLISIAAVCGHNWTVFLNFKGGKGIATTLGVLIGLTIQIASLRPVVLWTLFVWIVSFLSTAIVSVASLIAAIFLPVMMVITGQPFELIFLGSVFCVFIVLRHRPNIRRLLSGQEPKVPLPFHRKKD